MDESLFGEYRLLSLVGEGGMGRVYRAYDTATNRTVALKVLPEHLAGDAGFRHRFLREARIAASLAIPTSFRSTGSARSTVVSTSTCA